MFICIVYILTLSLMLSGIKCCIVICTLNQYLPLIGTIKLLLLLLLLLFNMFIYMKVGHSKFVEMHGDAYAFCRSALVFYTQHQINIMIYWTVYLHTDMCKR
jgi:hypothetical protein